jgi:coiled-coil domain-containing protein 55
MKLSFSLKGKAVGTAPSLKPVTPFTSLEDGPVDAVSTPINGRSEINQRLVAQTSSVTSRATRKKLEQEKKVDETIFEYDEVYDLMEQAKQWRKEKRDIETGERKVRRTVTIL